MFSKGAGSSISLAMVTPSLMTVGGPHFLSSATGRPLGPRVGLTASARVSTPFLRALLHSCPKIICFAISPPYLTLLGKNIALANDDEFLVINLVLAARVLGIDHHITHLEVRGDRSEEHTSELQSRLHLVCR